MNKCRYRSKGFMVLILALTWIILAPSPSHAAKSKKIKIGLIGLAMDVYQHQQLFESEKKRLEKKLIQFLSGHGKIQFKKRRQFFDDSKYLISYSDIEDPDVTIDPIQKARYKKILTELCTKKDLDGIIFGHFQEEKKLHFVLRLYIDDKNIQDDLRLISMKPLEMDMALIKKDKMAGLTQATDKQVEALKAEILSRFFSPKTTVAKTITTPQKTFSKEEELATQEAFQMIIEKGFFCQYTYDKKRKKTYQQVAVAGLKRKGFRVPKNYTFEFGRKITAKKVEEKGERFIRTESAHLKDSKDSILLYWPRKFTGSLTLEKAWNKINSKNKKNKNKSKKWRIPTLMELLSIIQKSDFNLLPGEFGPPPRKSLVFWTSTRMRKVHKLELSSKKKAYFVVQLMGYKNKKNNKYQYYPIINFKNINEKAHLLPVYSDKEYRYGKTAAAKGSQTNIKIHGFDDVPDANSQPGGGIGKNSKQNTATNTSNPKSNANTGSQTNSINSASPKIHGFDDVPDPPNSSPKPSHLPSQYGLPSVNILIIPYIESEKFEEVGRLVFPNFTNQVVEDTLNKLRSEILNTLQCRINISIFEKTYVSRIKKFYQILLNPIPTKEKKISLLRERKKDFPQSDIFVAGKFVNYNNKYYTTFSYVISWMSNAMFIERSIGEDLKDDEHKTFIRKKIYELISKNLNTK